MASLQISHFLAGIIVVVHNYSSGLVSRGQTVFSTHNIYQLEIIIIISTCTISFSEQEFTQFSQAHPLYQNSQHNHHL